VVGVISLYEAATLIVICSAHIGATRIFAAYPTVSRWLLDYSSGLGLGYAFLYLLPKIGTMSTGLRDGSGATRGIVDHQLYFYMLLGFLTYYLVDFKRHSSRPAPLGLTLNVLSFSVYSALIGATVVHLNNLGSGVYVTSAVVFTLHLFGVNKFLYRMYPEDFDRWMRWLFVAAMFVGAYAGTEIERYNPLQSVATALVGGIIIILSVRLKLPARARVNTRAFLIGVATAVLAVVIYSGAGAL